MKNLIKALSSMSLALTLNACSSGHNGSGGTPFASVKSTVNSSDNSTNDFDYSLLMFKQSGVCGVDDMQEQFVSAEPVKIGTAVDGKDKYAEAAILLYPNGKYEAVYKEEDMIDHSENHFSYQRYRARNLQGTWTKQNGKLVLSKLGELSARMDGDKIIASFLYTLDIVSEGLQNKTVDANRVSSTTAIKIGREACPVTAGTPGIFAQFMNDSHSTETSLNSLQMVENGDLIWAGGMLATDLELVLQSNGQYYIVVTMFANLSPLEIKTYIVDQFSWVRNNDELELYSGALKVDAVAGEATLTFSHDLDLIENGSVIGKIPTTGKVIEMKMDKSIYTTDDLTSVYQDGGAPIFNH